MSRDFVVQRECFFFFFLFLLFLFFWESGNTVLVFHDPAEWTRKVSDKVFHSDTDLDLSALALIPYTQMLSRAIGHVHCDVRGNKYEKYECCVNQKLNSLNLKSYEKIV